MVEHLRATNLLRARALGNALGAVSFAENATVCDSFGDYLTTLDYGASDLTRRIRDREDERTF